MWSRGLVSLTLGMGLSSTAWGKQVAVVVGLSSYGNLPDELHLESARDDARALGRFLEDEGGYDEVHVLLDGVAKKEAVRGLLLDTVAPELSPGDTLLWAFVGHGIGGDFNDPYLLLYDSQLGDPDATALRLRDFGPELVRRAQGVELVLVTDSAHEGEANGIAMMGPSAKSWPNLLGSTFLLSAAAPNEVAPEGMFVPLLVDGLRGHADANADGTVTASEIHRHLLVKVAEATGDTVHPAEAGTYTPGMAISKASVSPPSAPAATVTTPMPTPEPTPKVGRAYGGPVSFSMIGLGAASMGFGFYQYTVGKALCTQGGGTLTCPDTEAYNNARGLSIFGYVAGAALVVGGVGVGFVPIGHDGGHLTVSGRF